MARSSLSANRNALTQNRRVPFNVPNSLDFGGAATDYVDMDDILEFERDDAFSFSFWFYPRDPSSVQCILGKRTSTLSGYQLFYGIVSNEFRFLLDTTTGSLMFLDSTNVKHNQWNHIVITYDGSSSIDGMNIYANNNNVNGDTSGSGISGSLQNDNDFRLGLKASDDSPFDGLMTNVRAHSKELTTAEIDKLYREDDDTGTSVVAHWDFSEGSGSTLGDVVGGLDGTINGATWTTRSPSKSRSAITSSRTAVS